MDEGKKMAQTTAPPSEEGIPEQAQLLIRIGKLTHRQVKRITAAQRKTGQSFATTAYDMRLLSREDFMSALSQQYSYPILTIDPDAHHFSQELVVGHEPFSAASEQIRSIRANLVASAVGKGTRSFVVTSARAGSGGTYFAANIAMAFAQMAVPTLLVDADLRRPRLAGMFGLSPTTEGLCQALRREKNGSPFITSNIIDRLSILTAGAVPPNPQELLGSAEFLALTNNMEKEFGVVIYDTSSAMEYADAFVIASRVGGAIIVARQHKTTFADISDVSAKLRSLQCKFVGTVLNTF